MSNIHKMIIYKALNSSPGIDCCCIGAIPSLNLSFGFEVDHGCQEPEGTRLRALKPLSFGLSGSVPARYLASGYC